MALTIHFGNKPERNWFTSTETIAGAVMLHIRKRVTVTKVVISLQGLLSRSRSCGIGANMKDRQPNVVDEDRGSKGRGTILEREARRRCAAPTRQRR